MRSKLRERDGKKRIGTARPPKTILGEGNWLRLVRQGRWEFVERINVSGIVALVAVTDDGDLILVEQRRAALGRRVIELPAGLVGDSPGRRAESLAAAARRELLEETGYQARRITLLAEGSLSAGTSSETVSLFLASGLRKVATGGGDTTENIRVHAVPIASARRWLSAKAARSAVIDLKVYAGLYFAERARRL